MTVGNTPPEQSHTGQINPPEHRNQHHKYSYTIPCTGPAGATYEAQIVANTRWKDEANGFPSGNSAPSEALKFSPPAIVLQEYKAGKGTSPVIDESRRDETEVVLMWPTPAFTGHGVLHRGPGGSHVNNVKAALQSSLPYRLHLEELTKETGQAEGTFKEVITMPENDPIGLSLWKTRVSLDAKAGKVWAEMAAKGNWDADKGPAVAADVIKAMLVIPQVTEEHASEVGMAFEGGRVDFVCVYGRVLAEAMHGKATEGSQNALQQKLAGAAWYRKAETADPNVECYRISGLHKGKLYKVCTWCQFLVLTLLSHRRVLQHLVPTVRTMSSLQQRW